MVEGSPLTPPSTPGGHILNGQRMGVASRPQGRDGNGRAPGKIRPGALLFILVVVAGIYVAILFIPPYWTYLSMQDPVRDAALTAITARDGEATARADLLRKSRDLGLRLEDENIEIAREGQELVVRVTWVEPVDLPRYRHNLHFLIEQRVSTR